MVQHERKKIVVVGSSNTDLIVKTRRIPKPGETIIGGEFFMAAGGKGANQAVAAARADREVVFIARVGNDIFGKQAIEGFVREGINVDFVYKDKDEPSGIALIFVGADGENSIAVASGANSKLTPANLQAAKDVLSKAAILLMQLETPMETVQAAAEMASKAKARVILNPAPAQLLSDNLLKHVSVLTPNETEAELLTGIKIKKERDMSAAAKALLSKGVEAVLITLGAQGVYVATPKLRELVPAFQVEAIDTTAAGDVFNGALAVALSENKTILEAAKFANAAAALSVTKLGAQPSVPYRNEIEDLLNRLSY
jgi:ribokinase